MLFFLLKDGIQGNKGVFMHLPGKSECPLFHMSMLHVSRKKRRVSNSPLGSQVHSRVPLASLAGLDALLLPACVRDEYFSWICSNPCLMIATASSLSPSRSCASSVWLKTAMRRAISWPAGVSVTRI